MLHEIFEAITIRLLLNDNGLPSIPQWGVLSREMRQYSHFDFFTIRGNHNATMKDYPIQNL